MSLQLGFHRSTWNNYERGTSQPSLTDLVRISKYFGIDITSMLESDLRLEGNLNTVAEDAVMIKKGNLTGKGKGNASAKNLEKSSIFTKLKENPDSDILYVRMPQVVTVDNSGKENVVFVPVRARAGYLNGYADPEFVSGLPAYTIPGLHSGNYRLFEIEGHSMYPTLHPGDVVIGQNIDQMLDVRDDRIYVVITKNEGVVVKRVLNRLKKDGKLILKSDNYKDRDSYPSIVCGPEEILEIWYVTGFISRQMRPPAEMYNRLIDLEGRFTLLEEAYRKLPHK
jgi:transcriptional regulator with XRE-family HTH domain